MVAKTKRYYCYRPCSGRCPGVCPCVSLPRVVVPRCIKGCTEPALLFAPHPHACPSHLSPSYFHGSSSKPSLPIPWYRRHQYLDTSATTRGTYHPSAFTTPTTTVVVGSRCDYAYDRLPNKRRQTDSLTYHTSTVHSTKKKTLSCHFLANRKSTTPSLLALANQSTPSS